MAKLRDRVHKKGRVSIFILTWALLVVGMDPVWRRAGRSWLPVGGMLAMMLKVDVEMGRFYSSRHAAEL
jgi:hypothetical protein